MRKLILASGSPRRKDLLHQIGLQFEIIPSNIEENISETDPLQLVKKLALLKAADVARRATGVVIGADTIVVADNTILGKPISTEDAIGMLERLNGSQHQVATGVAIVDSNSGREWLAVEVTQVFFRKYSSAEILKYVASGEPMDKAGAYAIQGQGSLFVQKIEGCFFNVMGLPLLKTAQLLKEAGIEILQ